jgi:hypothetical protein
MARKKKRIDRIPKDRLPYHLRHRGLALWGGRLGTDRSQRWFVNLLVLPISRKEIWGIPLVQFDMLKLDLIQLSCPIWYVETCASNACVSFLSVSIQCYSLFPMLPIVRLILPNRLQLGDLASNFWVLVQQIKLMFLLLLEYWWLCRIVCIVTGRLVQFSIVYTYQVANQTKHC